MWKILKKGDLLNRYVLSAMYRAGNEIDLYYVGACYQGLPFPHIHEQLVSV